VINEVKGCGLGLILSFILAFVRRVTSEVMASLDYYIHFIYQAASAEGFAVGLTPKNVYVPLIGK
jgi:hypothetical protein